MSNSRRRVTIARDLYEKLRADACMHHFKILNRQEGSESRAISFYAAFSWRCENYMRNLKTANFHDFDLTVFTMANDFQEGPR